MNRRLLLLASAAALAAGPLAAEPSRLSVAKSPTCGCCGAWVDHMRAAGSTVDVQNMAQEALYDLKARLGVGDGHASCHTGVIHGYVVEGHVPAEDVKRLLAERPEGLGLAVPGMPTGSPGMEYGDEKEPYDTLLLLSDGSAQVFSSHR